MLPEHRGNKTEKKMIKKSQAEGSFLSQRFQIKNRHLLKLATMLNLKAESFN